MYFVKTNTIDFSTDRNFCLYKIDGLCPPSATLNFSTIANVDGTVYNSGRINQRNLVLYVKIFPDVETNRNILYKHFPIGQKVRIFYRNDLHNVYIDGYVESFECDLFTNNEVAQISIICNDPYFRSVEKSTTVISVVHDYFEFPFSIPVDDPIVISDRNYYVEGVVNPGIIPTGMTVEFEAIGDNVLNPWLENKTTGQKMIVNAEIDTGEKIVVSTNKHNLSVTKVFTDGRKENILNSMGDGFQWVQLAAGENRIAIGSDQNSESLVVSVNVEKLLLGV